MATKIIPMVFAPIASRMTVFHHVAGIKGDWKVVLRDDRKDIALYDISGRWHGFYAPEDLFSREDLQIFNKAVLTA